MKLFLDANIILDIYDSKRPSYKYSLALYKYAIRENFELFTSCDLITTIYYVNSRKDKNQALLNIRDINNIIEIINFSNKEINDTCNLMLHDKDYRDLEDTLQYILAKNRKCDLIISNDKNFVSHDMELLSSKEFCDKIAK